MDDELDAQVVIDLLQSDLENERRKNLVLRARLQQLEAQRAAATTPPEQPVG